MNEHVTPEHFRLHEDKERTKNWKRWGPYLSERQWATVREDYSATGECWEYFPHDHARSRAYRWGEDGIFGITDRECRLCFGLAMWNGRDPILKERLFGLTGQQGNHGEDSKECWWYRDSTPTHSWMEALYKYPQAEFPYERLVELNRNRDRLEGEVELADTGVFDNGYWDVAVTYAKAAPEDLCILLTVTNRGPATASIDLLPTLWFRNTWSWGCKHDGCTVKPRLHLDGEVVCTKHETLGDFHFSADNAADGTEPTWLFTDNETNFARLYDGNNPSPWVKDAFHRRVVSGEVGAVNPKQHGTKTAAWYHLTVPAGVTAKIAPVSPLPPGVGTIAAT